QDGWDVEVRLHGARARVASAAHPAQGLRGVGILAVVCVLAAAPLQAQQAPDPREAVRAVYESGEFSTKELRRVRTPRPKARGVAGRRPRAPPSAPQSQAPRPEPKPLASRPAAAQPPPDGGHDWVLLLVSSVVGGLLAFYVGRAIVAALRARAEPARRRRTI